MVTKQHIKLKVQTICIAGSSCLSITTLLCSMRASCKLVFALNWYVFDLNPGGPGPNLGHDTEYPD
jgi:hypothetical protein